jgi:hypothetical protein
MKRYLFLAWALLCPTLLYSGPVVVTGQQAGPTPFINFVSLSITPAINLKSVQFTIRPRPGSLTRPISVTYSGAYLKKRGYFNSQDRIVTVPVFGLYANYLNTVTITSTFTNGASQRDSILISAPGWDDSCERFSAPIVIQPRTNSTDLSYDYMLVKNLCGNQSPVIVDTDGEVRWVGTTGAASFSSIFYDGAIYFAFGTELFRIEFDGSYTPVADYKDIGVTSSWHHNIDRGKRGMLLEVNTATQFEAVIMEVDASGRVLDTWDTAEIIRAAMTAGGDDPAQFVQDTPGDWFHNNAATYRKTEDALVISSRENFVISVDYKSQAINWILGDPTKQWYQFSSLRKYALALGANTLPPIGQHSVSFTRDDDLLLFDNGTQSLYHTPAGASRDYSAPRKYDINLRSKTATEVWNYPGSSGSNFSPFCGSVYEDKPRNYLVTYAMAGPGLFANILGLTTKGEKVFEYHYPTQLCGSAWNAIPIHLEGLTYKK